MNKFQKHIDVLVQDSPRLTIKAIQDWLVEHENHLKFLVSESNCRKWSGWVDDKSVHIFPCICPEREEDCIFIEIYYKLYKVFKLYYTQEHIKEVLQGYELIKDDFDAVYQWSETHTNLGDFFEGKISINHKNGNFTEILFDDNGFETVIKLQKTIMDIYCSEEYQIRDAMNNTFIPED